MGGWYCDTSCVSSKAAAGTRFGGSGGSGEGCGGLYGVNDWLSPWVEPALAKDKTGGARGHLERRGHIAHIKEGRESRSLR